jgi:methylated-DNA-[protein]-cysteine S-methyltransferase
MSAEPLARRTSPTAEPLVRRTAPSPIGDLLLVAGARGLRAVLWPGEDGSRVHLGTSGRRHRSDGMVQRAPDSASTADPGQAERHLDRAQRQLEEYFAGTRRAFDVDLDPLGTPFQLQAWAVLRTIPFGQTMSYGQQARALGDPARARAVGSANGRNPISIIVPCHRVVATSGALTGFAGGLDTKAWLLEHERRVLAGQ